MEWLTAVFYETVEISAWTGLAAVLFLMLRSSVLRKMPKRVFGWVWMLLFLRLLFPVTVETSWGWELPGGGHIFAGRGSLFAMQEAENGAGEPEGQPAERHPGKTAEADGAAESSGLTEANGLAEADSAAKAAGLSEVDGAAKADGLAKAGSAAKGNGPTEAVGAGKRAAVLSAKSAGRNPGSILTGLWLLGIAVLAAGALGKSVCLKVRLRTAVRMDDADFCVRESDRIRSPFVFGIRKPVIYLPKAVGQPEAALILLHEKAHICRRDPLLKLLCFAAVVLHWFNPAVWLMFGCMTQDMEMACDERALRTADPKLRIAYSRVLLSAAAQESGLLPVFFGESNTKKRVKNVLQEPQMTPGRWKMALTLLVLLSALLLAVGVRKKEGKQETVRQETAGTDVGQAGEAAQAAQAGEETKSRTPQQKLQEKQDALWEQHTQLQGKIAALEQMETDLKQKLDAVLKEMGDAPEDGKQEWIEKNNELVEEQVQLLEEKARLEEQLQELENQWMLLKIEKSTGTNLAEQQRDRLASLPEKLDESNATEYGIWLDQAKEDDDGAFRTALWQFYVDTGMGKGTLPTGPEAMDLQTPDATGDPEDLLSGRVIAKTLRLGRFTDEGDLIVLSVTAWGSGYLILTDQSRDRWKGKDAEDVTVTHARYINWLTEKGAKTGEGKPTELVVASDRPGLTYEELTNSMLSSSLDAFIPYVYLGWFQE